MTIQVTCSGCFRTYGVKDEYAGRRIKCPDCGEPVQIPAGGRAAPAAGAGDDDFGDHDFGSASAPKQRTRQSVAASRSSSGGGGTSFAVIAAIAGVVGVVFLAMCGGVIWLGVNAIGNDPVAVQQDQEIERALAGRQVGGTREESGRLGFTDDTLETGEYCDEYTVTANAGDVFVIDLYSDDFDTYLMVLDDSELTDFQIENDDFATGDTSHSQLVLTAPSTGSYRVVATSYESGETGAYQLSIREVASDATSGGTMREETGTLDPSDPTLELGEYVDKYPLSAQQGELIVIDMYSNEFDTYLFITGPNGFSLENDDFGGSTTHSQLTVLIPTTGEYEINATSLGGGETGSYRLTIQGQ